MYSTTPERKSMSKRASKKRARRKKKANHGHRPNQR
ncbi:50S ribosomal protein bL37 [Nocardia sp. CDC160]